MMIRRASLCILFLSLLMAFGCGAKSGKTFVLTNATELVASPGTEREVRLTGDELSEFLETFEPLESNDLTLHTTSETGTLTIDGETHTITISHVKTAARPATLTIDKDGQQLVYRQRAESEPRLR